MNCTACGHTNPERTKFCLECGTPLAARCAGCGNSLPPAAKFCGECGAQAAAPAKLVTEKERPLRDVRDYTPKHLAEKILQGKSALEGERKQVTVLFADVKGSMELAGQLDPEAWHRILERFFEILTEGVHRFEGTVNQYTGDGIMALFGAPIAHEDHAQRACYAALHLLERLREYARSVRREHGLDFATRIGLNSGEVVVGKIGDDLRMDYTAQGHTVGLAQRIEALAEADACFLSSTTAALVSGFFALEDLGEFRLKGASDPLHVFRLAGLGAARTRFDVSRSRGLTRFVGRPSEMQTLTAALEAARAGHGAVAAVVAQAGTGKSRLCFELVESCRAVGLTVHEGRAQAHGKSVPLIPVLEIFRSYFGIGERDDERTAREKIAGRLLLLDESFRDVLPILFDFLGVVDSAQPLPPMEPEARQRQLFGVARRLMPVGAALSTDAVGRVLGYVPTWIGNRGIAGKRMQSLLSADFAAEFPGRDPYQMFLNRIDLPEGAPRDPLNQSMWLWLKSTFPNKLLNFLGDRMEMAHSIEGRTPFLDHPLVDLVCQMPVSMKVRGMTEKFVLREAAKPFLTDTVYKRQKHPFMAPFELKGRMRELVDDTLRGPVLGWLPFFDRAAVLRMLDNVPEGGPEVRGPHFATLMVLTSICVLHERYKMA